MGARIIALAFCLASLACTVMTGNGTGFTYASVGGNAENLNITPTGATASKIDNATGAAIAREAIGDMASAYALGKAFDALSDVSSDLLDWATDANATDKAINANNNATKAEIKTFVPPEPVVTPP
jgi:hypothetical protein